MKAILKGLGLLSVLIFLAACKNDEALQANKEEETHQHTAHETSEHADKAVIEGAADHYHTGDMAELTVNEEGLAGEHWHWYTSDDEENWKVIEGEEKNTLITEAKDGQYIKAVLYDENHEAAAESETVKITIDDHTGDIYEGYFENGQVEDRNISDWAGEWQSVYPYLESGVLDEVFEHKAESGDMSAEEYKEYYREGYMTEVSELEITDHGELIFHEGDNSYSGKYIYDGYEILEYEAGNRGVRYIFKQSSGDDKAPEYIQFSDHMIAPEKSGHFHLYWGDDRNSLLEEVTHWPTYYPAKQSESEIKQDMLKH